MIHGPQHARLPSPLSSPKVYPSSYPLHLRCHPAISSSDALFSFCPQPFPVSGTFLMSQLFTSGDQNTGASASASVLPMSIQDGFPLGLSSLISLQPKGLSRVLSNTTVQKHQFFWLSVFFIVQLSYPYMTTGETIALNLWTFVGKVMSLFFNMLFRFVIAFLPRSNRFLISLLQ